jgi:hypothetical protein
MKRFFGKLSIAGLAVGFLCVMGDGVFAKGPNPERPYRARSQETQTLNLCEAGDELIGQEFAGMGNATHAGLTSTLGCVVFTGDPNLPPYVLNFEGQGSGTAANGDATYFDIVDGVSHLFPPPCVATYSIVFTGGTGRFEEASGSADCTSIRANCGLDQTTTCVGTISY